MSQHDVRTYPQHGEAGYGIGPVRWTPDPTRPAAEQLLEVHLGGQVYRFTLRDCQVAEALDDWWMVAPEGQDATPLGRMVWRARNELTRCALFWREDVRAWERALVRTETAEPQATAA